LKIISRSTKKTDRNDARILAKLLRTGDLPESYLPSKKIDELRTAKRYRRSLGEEKMETVEALKKTDLIADNEKALLGTLSPEAMSEVLLVFLKKLKEEGKLQDLADKL